MQSPSAGSSRNRLHGRRVLVVEDEALVAMLLEDELTEAGAEVLGPKVDIDGALRLIETAAPGCIDLAVLDFNLRGASAAPVAAALVQRGIPFVIATGYADGHMAEAPGAPVLCKPYDGQLLIEILAGLLECMPACSPLPEPQQTAFETEHHLP